MQLQQEEQIKADAWLRGRCLLAASMAWIAVALLAVGVFAVSIPPFFDLLRTPCAIESCNWQLQPASIQTLRQLGFSLDAWASFTVAEDVVVGAVGCHD